MGIVDVPMLLAGRDGRTRTVKMLVDSGAVWSLLPSEDWHALGLAPERSCAFSLADGTTIERKVSECRFTYQGESATSPVILGEADDVALLGAVTLESLALVLNPFDRSLYPMRMMLAQLRAHHRCSVRASDSRSHAVTPRRSSMASRPAVTSAATSASPRGTRSSPTSR